MAAGEHDAECIISAQRRREVVKETVLRHMPAVHDTVGDDAVGEDQIALYLKQRAEEVPGVRTRLVL